MRGVWGAFGFFLQQCEFLGFLRCLMMRRGRRGERGAAGADCRLGWPFSWSWQLGCFEMITTLVCWAVSYQLACSKGWRAWCCVNVPVRARGKICRWKQRYYKPRRFHILKPLASACFTPSSSRSLVCQVPAPFVSGSISHLLPLPWVCSYKSPPFLGGHLLGSGECSSGFLDVVFNSTSFW